ncbi:ATP-binding cassette domain-containing protein [Anaerotignum sp.]|uniref:ATP-binding cassette domain-containing protein n=1 Tax=Anaerotignum sp. TaxID=2039241 RepID=UPI002A91E8B4|nr:ATP-binding cassette domain-containing protein [Anaerotignum sp.]MCI7657392.1 ATP-binding cassette domain-containing protein [Clostridia bacterium]MDY5414488.1 ATP-binding cassette domain-containing protein [Anaerotignum sp.]
MIEIKHITKKYDDYTVFSDFSMEIQEGEVLCLMGKSGRGKTTLLRMLMGLEQPDTGSITGLTDKRISVVFQEDRLLPGFTVRQNLYSVCDDALQQERMMGILTALGLDAWIDREVSVLSGGMQRRVAICRALLVPYDLLILDEPFRGLDDKTKEITLKLVLEEKKGRTILLSTHDAKECERMGGKILNLDEILM